MRYRLLATLIATSLLGASLAEATTLAPEQRFRTLGDFSAKKAGKPARDVSGLACMPAANGAQRCLLINDEGSFAQFARIAENRITPDATLPIIGADAYASNPMWYQGGALLRGLHSGVDGLESMHLSAHETSSWSVFVSAGTAHMRRPRRRDRMLRLQHG